MLSRSSKHRESMKRRSDSILLQGPDPTSARRDGGWKITSGSDNAWLSKLYISRFIATTIPGIEEDEQFHNADDAHYRWLLNERNSYFAWSDRFKNGTVVGSRYYPRGVTGVLWLEEKQRQ